MSANPEAQAQAAQDLDDIAALRRHPAFSGFFQRKVKERTDALAKRVLDGPHESPEALWAAWQEYRHALDYAQWLDRHEAGCRRLNA